MNKDLIEILEKGNLEKLRLYVENKGDINIRHGSDKGTMLHIAALHGHLEMVTFLLENGLKTEDRDCIRSTPLYEAVYGGHLLVVVCLLKHGAKIDNKYFSNDTLLHVAARGNHWSIAELLLNHPNTNPNEINNNDYSPLTICVRNDHSNVACALLKKGAYVDTIFNDKSAHQMNASKNCTLILKASGELLNLAAGSLKDSNSLKKIKENLDVLGRNINGRQALSGDTALHLAIMSKQTDTVKMLLERAPDVLIKNHRGESALTLLQQSYSDEPYLISLAMLCALNQIEETLSFQKKYKIFLNETEIKKQVVEQQKLEIKEQKEVKESKEQKEIRETKKMDEHQLFLSVNKQILDQCEQYLDSIEIYFEKLSDEKQFEIGFLLGKLLSNRNRCLFSPSRAYQFLSNVAEPKFSQNPKFTEIHKRMLELLISKSIIFEIEGLSGEPHPISVSVELDGHSTIESKESESHRLFCIIKHILYSKSEHDDALGKYISHYIQETGSVMGLKDVHDKSIPSQLALIKAFKEQSELSRKREQELKTREARKKALEEMLKKKELELKRLLDELNSLNVQNSQNLASNGESIETSLKWRK